MATASTLVQLDSEIDAAARDEARLMSRNVAEQSSPDVSLSQVQAVLRGQANYDALNVPEQAIVRTAWAEVIAERRAALNLAEVFEAEGHAYAELDEKGEIRLVTPKP
ncbi:hypothetical protein D3874_19875 [Oleomonas cavernae]|uniref:Uncharacterized protein n=1 Tax=Oleomonas cavernae TaxID=2320859 RepID=A0A418WG09_9PROT|nr:hypothetical protein [Oleomonas cavernae]RJF88956.1 hypothetical protein D3874_19875 [Oleomonas cavernae]